MERKRTTPAKVLKAWAARGSFRVFSERAFDFNEIREIESNETRAKNTRYVYVSKLPEGYCTLHFKIHPDFDEKNIAEAKRRGDEFVGRIYTPVPLDEPCLWYEPQHAALQSKVDAVLGVDA